MTSPSNDAKEDLDALRHLYEVGNFCSRAASPLGDCLDRLVGAAMALAGADAGQMQVLDRASGRWSDAAHRGLDEAAARLMACESPPGTTPLTAAWQRGQRVLAGDLQASPDAATADAESVRLAEPGRCALIDAGLRAWAAMPLLGGLDQLLGVITLYFREPHEPSERQARVLDLLARQASDYLERRAIESAVRDSEERFRAFTSATADVVYRMNADWTEMQHLQGREFVHDTLEPNQRWLTQYVPSEDRATVQAAIDRAITTQAPFELQHRVILIDGSVGWTDSRAIPVLDAEGRIIEWFGTASDITHRKVAEEALLASEWRYRTLFDSIDEGYCIIRVLFDEQGRASDYVFLEVNKAFERQTGIEDAAGRSMRSISPDHEDLWFEIYGKIARTGQPARFESAANALHRYYDVYAFPFGAPENHQVAVLFKDVSERRNYEESLREANRRKDEFLATLAHELRNPLAPIRNGLHILQRADADRQAAARVLPMLQRQIDHMVRLVDDLLEVSRITGGKVELRPERVDVSTIMRSAVETSRPLIDAGHHRLVVEYPGDHLFVEADPVRMSQVIANLLNNAAKYTDHGGRICLEALRDGDEAVLRVTDNGIGIAADMLTRVFDLFTQAEHQGHRAQGGLGIGLTLVRSLVEMHGGRVEASSEGVGHGSSFTVRLPLAGSEAPMTAPLATPSPSHRRQRILVVDDNVDAAESLQDLLELMGMDVRAVHDGASGLRTIASFEPDLVLLDIGMPGMDGYEFARRIHDERGEDRPMLVAVSGWGQEDDYQRSRAAGIDHHLVKPVDLAELEGVLALAPRR